MILKIRPEPKRRPRFSGHAYTDPKTKAYEQMIGFLYVANKGKKYQKAVRVEVRFFYKSTKQQYKKTRPDLDNLLKAIMDGLNGVAWNDDSQVVEVIASKHFGEADYISLTIQEVD